MKIVVLICRILLGLIFLVFGLNGFFHFLPMKAEGMPPQVITWTGIMMATGWMKAISAVQVLGGALVLTGFLLPVGVVLLCALTFNILCFHLGFMGGQGIIPGLVTGFLELAVIYGYRAHFAPLFATKATLSV